MRNPFIVMMLFNQERPTEISNLKCDLWLLDFVNCKHFDLFDFYGYHSSFYYIEITMALTSVWVSVWLKHFNQNTSHSDFITGDNTLFLINDHFPVHLRTLVHDLVGSDFIWLLVSKHIKDWFSLLHRFPTLNYETLFCAIFSD